MTDRGTVRDTYAAALQHDLIALSGGERIVGVVRRPLPWLLAQVDENLSALGPPEDLLEDVKAEHEHLSTELPDAEAHNRAMEIVDYDARYLDFLETSSDAQAALADLEAQLAAGTDVVLVCYENTDEKRCHRTLVKRKLESR